MTTQHQNVAESIDQSLHIPKRCKINDPLFNLALDRTQISTRHAMMIVNSILTRQAISSTSCTLWWQTLTHLNGNNHDFLTIVVSVLDAEKLLGISRLPVRSEALMGQEVKFVSRQISKENLAPLGFDTPSITRINAGPITVAQRSFNR